MEGKGIYTILLSIIAVLTLSLAVLIIFLFVSYNPNRQAAGNVSPGTTVSERIVADDEMIQFKLFNGEDKMFALKAEDENPDAIILVSVAIKCDAGPKKRRANEITDLINNYITELEQAVGDYFADMTLSEAKELESRYKARDDLLNIFNDILNENKREKEKIVYRVTLQMFPQ